MATEKTIQLKDKQGNKLFPKVNAESIPAGAVATSHITDNAVTKDKLSQDLQAKLDGVATTEGLAALQQTVDTLNGDAAKAGSVKKQIADAIAGVTQFDVQVVTALPAASAAKKGVLYLIKDTHTDAAATGATDTYDEYIFLPGTTEGTGTFEKIGNTDLDISGKADTSKLTDGSIKVKSATEADNAAKVGGHTVAKDVPADAKLTDTVYDDTALAGRVSTLEGAALCYYEEVTE